MSAEQTIREWITFGTQISTVLHSPVAHKIVLQKAAQLRSQTLNINNTVSSEEEKQEIIDGLQKPGPSSIARVFSMQLSAIGQDLRNIGDPDQTAVLLETHWAARWASFGLPLFSLTDDLVAALLLTDPPDDFDVESFCLPFPAFAVTIPPGLLPLYRGEERGSGVVVRVHRMIAHAPKEQSRNEHTAQDVVHLSIDGDNDRRIYRMHPIARLIRHDEDMLHIDFPDDRPPMEFDNNSFAFAVRLIRNLVTWIEAHGTGSPEPRPRVKGYTRRQQATPLPTTWVLGREVKLGPELHRLAVEVASGDREGWKLGMRFCVRGHWKWQVCGEGRRERKRIFVEPYWKGPEGAAAWQHVYNTEVKP